MSDTRHRVLRGLSRYRGVALTAGISTASLWFAVSGRLVYFVNPSYVAFTIVMCAIALAFCVAWVVVLLRREPPRGRHSGESHDHELEDDAAPRGPLRRIGAALTAVVAAAVVAGMIVLPPATLSSATAIQRDVASTTVSGGADLTSAQRASTAAFAHFTVRDWASLLAQTTDATFYDGKPVDLTGFVSPDPRGSADVFYLSRFVVTCCAVDAQPVGVPVYRPTWKDTLKPNQWVHVTGAFAANPSTSSDAPIALTPAQLSKTDVPAQPYLY